MIERIFSNTGLLKDGIDFLPGVNLILGRYATEKQLTGINGVGKSTLIRLIDYVLLSDHAEKIFSKPQYDFLREQNHEVTLQIRVDEKVLFLSRGFGKNKNYIDIGDTPNRFRKINIQDAKIILLDTMFPITDEQVRYQGNRYGTLMSFFIKDDIENQQRVDPLRFYGSGASDLDVYANNCYLLGIPNSYMFSYMETNEKYSELNNHVKSMIRNLEKDTGRSLGELKSERVRTEEEIRILEKSLENYRFLDRYKNIETELGELTEKIRENVQSYHGLGRKLAKMREDLNPRDNINVSEIESVYMELSEAFGALVKKSLADIIEFRTKLIENRIRYNDQRSRDIQSMMKDIEEEIKRLEYKRSQLFHQLEEKGQLESVTNAYKALIEKRTAISSQGEIMAQIENDSETMTRVDLSLAEARINVYDALKNAREIIDDLRALFLEIIDNALFLSEEKEGEAFFDIKLRSKPKRNQVPFEINMEVPKVDAFGRGRLKLVAYDLMVFLHSIKEGRRLPRFLVHDGMYHGIAKRTMVDTLNYIHKQSLKYSGMQYIASFNEDEIDIPKSRRSLDGEFIFDIEKATVASFKDDPAGMIFGRMF